MNSRNFCTALLHWLWRLAKMIAVAAATTVMAHMVIIPIIIDTAITIASNGLSELLYGSIASCIGAFMISAVTQALLSEEVGVDGYPKWNGWIPLSLLFASIGTFLTGREAEFKASVALTVMLLLVSIGALFIVIDDSIRRGDQTCNAGDNTGSTDAVTEGRGGVQK